MRNRGFGLIEILIGSFIIVSVIGSIIFSYKTLLQTSRENLNNFKAQLLLEDTQEKIKILRNESWNNISAITAEQYYYITENSNNISIGNADILGKIDGKFERKFKVFDVYRDASFDIVGNNLGSIDSDTKRIVTEIIWDEQDNIKSRVNEFYIMNILK